MLPISAVAGQWLDFLWAMTEKEIKARYKYAVLGFLWIVINPLSQMLVIGYIFQFFVPINVDNYFIFLFTGLLPWNFFSYSVSKTTPIILNERSLIQKAKFPREAIVLSVVFSNLFHFMIALTMVLLFHATSEAVSGDLSVIGAVISFGQNLQLIPVLIWLVALTSGLSLLFSALNVRFRDVNFFLQAIMPLWFYATPILYRVDLLPESVRWLMYLNPVSVIIEFFQAIILGLPQPSLLSSIYSLVFSLLVFLVGWKVFTRESLSFDDWI